MTANRYRQYLTDAVVYQYGTGHEPSAADLEGVLERLEAELRDGGYTRQVVEREMAQARAAAAEFAAPTGTAFGYRDALRAIFRRKGVVRSLIAVVLVIAYVLPLALFFSERGDETPFDGADVRDLALGLRIAVVDLARDSLTFQIQPAAGALLDASHHLARDVSISFDAGTGIQKHTFPAGVPLTPWTVQVAADSGDILDYPFDAYEIDFDIQALSDGKIVKLTTGITHVPHGLQATRTESPLADGGDNVVVRVSRTGTIIFVAVLSTLSLALVTLAACTVAWQVARRGRTVEFSMMTWVAALLFVIPSVRSGLPGSVPPGALIDYAIFYWLQIATVSAMASLVWSWTRRKT